VVPHDQWSLSQQEVETHTKHFTDWLKKYIQSPVYLIEGNHDFAVINSQNFTQTDPAIKYDLKQWKPYLSPEAQETFKKNGFYSEYIQLKDGTDFNNKARVIALNTQSCYFNNYFLISTHQDPAGQLEWLENLLKDMEKKGELGIIMGHVPSGSDCINNWAYRVNALLERYQHILRTQIYGHVHAELFSTSKGYKTGKPFAN